jgi:hypothetical protein
MQRVGRNRSPLFLNRDLVPPGKSKRHGFVNFEEAEAAQKCVSAFNGTGTLAAAGEKIDVVEHLKKSERFPTATCAKPHHFKVRFALQSRAFHVHLVCSLAGCTVRYSVRRLGSAHLQLLPPPPDARGLKRRQRLRPSARQRKSRC